MRYEEDRDRPLDLTLRQAPAPPPRIHPWLRIAINLAKVGIVIFLVLIAWGVIRLAYL